MLWSSASDDVTLELVRAVHSQPAEQPIVKRLIDYLPTMAGVRLMHDHPDVVDWPVTEYDDYSQDWRILAERGRAARPELSAPAT